MDQFRIEKKADVTICNDARHLGVAVRFDCKFIVGSDPNTTEIVYGCKYVFAIESPVFERMLYGDFEEAQNPLKAIPLPDDEPNTMRHFRLLACCVDRESCMGALSLDDIVKLTQFCHKYMALSIIKLCTDRLLSFCESADNEDLIKMFAVSRLFPGTSLFETVIAKLWDEYLLEGPVNDLKQDAFMDYIFYLPEWATDGKIFTTIERYLNCNNLIPKHLVDDEETGGQIMDKNNADALCNDPENLALTEEKLQQNFLKNLLKRIDFRRMGAREFVSGPGASNILTLAQKYHCLSDICSQKHSS